MNSSQHHSIDTEKIKSALYAMSPHLHPRIIQSVPVNSVEGKLEITINEKASSQLLETICNEIRNFNARKYSAAQQDHVITFNFPQKDVETLIHDISANKNFPDYINIARDIKNSTHVYDYEIAEKKWGKEGGVKLGNTYFKELVSTNPLHILNFFVYNTFHRFLGTKSPQVDLLQDKNGKIWMASHNLSQTYQKNGAFKEKKFYTIDQTQSTSKSTSIVDSIDIKSAAQLFLLAMLFRTDDLRNFNIGIINGKNKNKLSIVDFDVRPAKVNFQQEKFLNLDFYEQLIDSLRTDFIFSCPAKESPISALINQFKNDVPTFQKAVESVFFPFTENANRQKTVFFRHEENVLFEPKSNNFPDVLEKSAAESFMKLSAVGVNISVRDTINNFKNAVLKNAELFWKSHDRLCVPVFPDPSHSFNLNLFQNNVIFHIFSFLDPQHFPAAVFLVNKHLLSLKNKFWSETYYKQFGDDRHKIFNAREGIKWVKIFKMDFDCQYSGLKAYQKRLIYWVMNQNVHSLLGDYVNPQHFVDRIYTDPYVRRGGDKKSLMDIMTRPSEAKTIFQPVLNLVENSMFQTASTVSSQTSSYLNKEKNLELMSKPPK